MTLDPYILQQASCRASLLVATAAFRPDDWEDLKQEIVLDVLCRSPKFDPTRGDWQGFVRGVMRNHAAVLVMRERRRAPEILSEDLMNRENASDADSLDILDKRASWGIADALHLSLDVHRVIEGLPTQLQSLAVLLGQMPIQDVCRQVRKSRSRVRQLTLQLRDAFVRAGFGPRCPRQSAVKRRTNSRLEVRRRCNERI
jgi:DNA-directed RNA polymerase specialized sigma24 family protein